MKKKILPRWLCLCICAGLFLTGCTQDGGGTPSPTPTPQPTPAVTSEPAPPEPQDGGTLRLAMRAPLTLNPLLNEDATVDRVLKLIFEPLTVLDENLKPAGNLVTLHFSSDYASVNLTLRNDIVWSDGTPITSDDILFSIDVLQNAPETAIYKHRTDNIAACEKLDNKTVKITFVEIFGGSGYLFNFPIIPRHYYQNEKDPAGEKNMTPLGNGLFLFDNYTAMKSMTLTQSPYSHRKRAYIQQVEALVIADMQTELHAFDQGLIDVISLELTEWSRHHSVKQTRYGEHPAMYYDFIGFNFAIDVMNDKGFREALARCIDADGLVPAVYLQHAVRTNSPINPASWLYETEIPVYSYDMAAAAELITRVQASREIPPLRVLVNEENDERVKMAEALVEGMTGLGLTVSLECEPFEDFERRIINGDFDIFLGGYNLSDIPDITFAFHTDAIATGSNLLAYSDVTLDRLLRLAFSAGTEDAYRQALSQVQRRIAEELPVISLAFRHSAVLTDTRIHGDLKPTMDNIFANVNEWFIAE